MPSERLLFRFANGMSEWRLPPIVPELGVEFERDGDLWVVDTIETDGDELTIVMLIRAKREPSLDEAAYRSLP
jgi:hypothetical protein